MGHSVVTDVSFARVLLDHYSYADNVKFGFATGT